MRYPHRWTCTRESAGTQDPVTGVWTPGGPTTVYSGQADCQDAGEVVQRDEAGRPTAVSQATLYLEDETAAPRHVVGDAGTVTWEDGTTSDARVVKITRLDGSLDLAWL